MAEYSEYGFGMRLDANFPSLNTGVTLPKKEIVTPDQALKSIRTLILSKPDVEFARTDDEFLLRFLHARKMNIQESFQLLVNYYSYRQRNRHLFIHLSAQDESIQQALRDGFPGVLQQRDRKGRCVLVIFTAHWDHCSYSLITVYRALLLTLEKLVEEKQNQLNGFVVVVDWTDFSFRQSSNLNPKVLKLMIEGLQDCFPARFKGIHFINQPWYVEALLTMIRPFLKEKTKEKIYMHGNNMSTLHEYVSKDILPAELGGEGPSFNPTLWSDELLEESLKTSEDPQTDTISNKTGTDSDSSSSDSDESPKKTSDVQVRKSETVPETLSGKKFFKKPLVRKTSHTITPISSSPDKS
ncbi:Clavesin-2 [Frankliniella fusca]|uniref:Clavesin-2 n=1 Tax=Frankliniella fusca TaxID=407009 RepID=A0AAE1HVQ8_9NEOP|nr:Clavesin-2 [Frankliniella fusca]